MTMRMLREGAGLTQQQVADRCGWRKQQVSQVELGQVVNPRQATLSKLAHALGVSEHAIYDAIRESVRARAERAA